jgi:hypothetical protein
MEQELKRMGDSEVRLQQSKLIMDETVKRRKLTEAKLEQLK